MRRLILTFVFFLMSFTSVFAAKIPEDVRNYLTEVFPNVDIRFDGVIVLPSNTVYLPLYPSLFTDIKSLKIKETYPANRTLTQEPDIVIFNNDFVLMKVLSDGKGHRTVLHQANPPVQVRTALLPQDMLVPNGLIIPENIKGIIGNLKIDTKNEDSIKVNKENAYEDFMNTSEPAGSQKQVSMLKNKVVYVTTNYSKNIQVIEPAKLVPSYSLSQKSIPIDVKAVQNGKFLLVTSYDRPFLDIVSIADSRFIKQIPLEANPEQIMLDENTEKAYVASPETSTIFVIDLKTMSLIQKIKVNGYCEHMFLGEGKLFYFDKLNDRIWSIETQNGYELKEVGTFPNVSAMVYTNGKLYISSRTKSRIAVVDYSTMSLQSEFTTVNKPIGMLLYKDRIYVLGSQNNEIQVLSASDNSILGTIKLEANGFSDNLKMINDTGLAMVCDLKHNTYTILDLNKNIVVSSYLVNVPVKDVIISEKVRLFD